MSAYLTTVSKTISELTYVATNFVDRNQRILILNTSGCNFSTEFVTLFILVCYSILNTRKEIQKVPI
jgi:hypothetical protein